MTEVNDDWSMGTLREAPFWRKGMMPEEYDIERMHWQRICVTTETAITYEPLWKQKEVGNPEYDENYQIAKTYCEKYCW